KAGALEGAGDFVAALLFSPDNARVYGLLINGHLLTWDLASGELLTTVRTPMIATRMPLFWHPATGELVAAIPSIAYTSYVSVDPESGALTLLTLHPGFPTYGEFRAFQEERGSRILNDIVAVPFAYSDATSHLPLVGDEVWTVNAQGQVALLSLGSGETQVLVEGGDRPILSIRDLTATEGGLVAFAETVEDTLYVIDLVNEVMSELPIEHDSALLSPDGTQFAQYNEDGTALLLTALEDGAVATLALPAGLGTLRPIMRLRFSPDGAMLAVAGLVDASEEGVILLYRMGG
ncbi:MAG TPA: hypothetical protein VER79_08075, partial [Candidatus Limnocylindrales bacterium]|nr:hypothetical protein [Candidatus Limnocylindrales bacterium]